MRSFSSFSHLLDPFRTKISDFHLITNLALLQAPEGSVHMAARLVKGEDVKESELRTEFTKLAESKAKPAPTKIAPSASTPSPSPARVVRVLSLPSSP